MEDQMVAARKLARALLILVLFGGLSGQVVGPVESRIEKLQPQLASLALQDPDEFVSVIVQGIEPSQARSAIEALGGVVSRELSLIRAFTAVMPAGEALALSADPAVRWISLDAPIHSSSAFVSIPFKTGSTQPGKPPPRHPSGEPDQEIDVRSLQSSFNHAVGAAQLWNEAPDFTQGRDVTVAVIDSGSFRSSSLGKRLIGKMKFNQDGGSSDDRYGHGTFINALIAADGSDSAGQYIGIAPRTNVISLRISDDTGRSLESDVVSAMQWVYDNRVAYNIRVVNLSLNSSEMQSYHSSPLCAAVEVLWANGILVVTAAGNSGTSGLYPPANDPFVITVGAVDDRGSPNLDDDGMAAFSAYGTTELGGIKPEIVAPGVDLIAYLPDHHSLAINQEHPENRVSEDYFRLSGTSVAAAVVSGAAALLFESAPQLTPDQAKFRLMATADQDWPAFSPEKAGAGYLDIYAAVKSTTSQSANSGLLASQLLWQGNDPLIWGNVAWGSVSWGSVAWGSVSWGSVAWGSDYWGD
jgi:serine protease AprX